MSRLQLCIAAILVVALLVAARNVGRVMAGAARHEIDRTLPPGHAKEECIDVPEAGRIVYSFSATALVYFNIHHHLGRKTVYDVERHKTLTADASLDVPEAARYCLTFSSAVLEDVQIKGRYGIVDSRPARTPAGARQEPEPNGD